MVSVEGSKNLSKVAASQTQSSMFTPKLGVPLIYCSLSQAKYLLFRDFAFFNKCVLLMNKLIQKIFNQERLYGIFQSRHWRLGTNDPLKRTLQTGFFNALNRKLLSSSVTFLEVVLYSGLFGEKKSAIVLLSILAPIFWTGDPRTGQISLGKSFFICKDGSCCHMAPKPVTTRAFARCL